MQIGSVVVGGLALSALLTLAIIPPLMSLISGFSERKYHLKHSEDAAD